MIRLKEFKEQVFEMAKNKGFSSYEVYFSDGKSVSVKVFEGEVCDFTNSENSGVSFRGVYNGKMGYSSSEVIDKNTATLLVENAILNANIIDSEDKEIIYDVKEDIEKIEAYSDKTEVSTMIDLSLSLEKKTYEYSNYVTKVSTCALSKGFGHTFIANNYGIELERSQGLVVAVLGVIVEKGDDKKTAYDFWYGRSFDEFNVDELAKKTVDKATAQFGASPVESNSYKVIIKNEAMIDLLDAYFTIFSASTVQKGFSVLKDKVGTKIGSELITLRDYCTYEDNISNSLFDDEGVKTKNKTIIENGVLKGYLYNLKSALKDNVKTTGNGFRSSFKGNVVTMPLNFFLEKGDKSYDDLINQMENGIIVTDLSGLHAGVKTINGDFSLLASGFLVEDKKIVRSVEQITISSNFLDLLQNTIGVSDDILFSPPSNATSIGSPSILISSISVAG